KQDLTDSEDPAAVLTWRISTNIPSYSLDAPLPWLPGIPPAVRVVPDTHDYLENLTTRVECLKDRVATEARQSGASQHAPWRRALRPDIDAQLISDLAVFRAAHGIPATDTRP